MKWALLKNMVKDKLVITLKSQCLPKISTYFS